MLLLILCVVALAAADSNYNCPVNEQPSNCVIPCNDCTNRGNCYYQCYNGCDCIPGYYRNANGVCIPAQDCPSPCPVNEQLTNCVIPCNDCTRRGICNYQCSYGCDCIPGYYRNANGTCIAEQYCPACPVNEGRSNCVSTCNTCKDRGYCNYPCNGGCDCYQGYYRNANGTCIPAQDCPSLCPVNEELSNCVCPCNDCKNRGNCYYQCYRGCDCKRGYYRNANGVCIAEQYCPACPVNEQRSNCVSPCNDCYYRGNCNYQCYSGCDCFPGYYRNGNGTCIDGRYC